MKEKEKEIPDKKLMMKLNLILNNLKIWIIVYIYIFFQLNSNLIKILKLNGLIIFSKCYI